MKPAIRQWLAVRIPYGVSDPEILVAALQRLGMLGLEEQADAFEVYFEMQDDIELLKAVGAILPSAGARSGAITISTIIENGWQSKWQEYFRPLKITNDIGIRPPWVEPERTWPIEIVIQPGMAFGTGTHATTQLALRLLEKYLRKGMRVMDAGCGSGILTIAALKLGAGYVQAWDIDGQVQENFYENLHLNACQTGFEFRIGDVTSLAEYPVDLIISNIERQANLKLLTQVSLQPRRIPLIFTGLLCEESAVFNEAVVNYGLEVLTELKADEWMALVVK